MELLAIVLLVLLFYTYLGYGLLAWVVSFFKQKTPPADPKDWPGITLIVPAFNEANWLHEKLQNCLNLEYPPEKLQILLITDGSNDGSEATPWHEKVQVLHKPQRAGKAAAINRAVPFAQFPILVITDANTSLNPNALKALARPFSNPNVGGVSGEKRVRNQPGKAQAQEGLYWKYESWLKRKDARLYTLVGAAGELFAFRANLFRPLESDAILDDFVLSVRIIEQGFRVDYAAEAKASEDPSPSIGAEWKRKIRIAAGAFQSMPRLSLFYKPYRYPMPWFQFFSRRLLRWLFAPWALLLFFILCLLLSPSHFFWGFLACLQIVFYALALIGFLGHKSRALPTLFKTPFYFVLMHAAIPVGFFRHLKGKQSALWDKAR